MIRARWWVYDVQVCRAGWREHHARLPVRLRVYRGARFYLARQFTQSPVGWRHARVRPSDGRRHRLGAVVGSMKGEGVTRARYRREGRCVRCGRAPTPARLTCARCQGLATQARARFRTTGRGAQYRREGRCRCGHPRDLAGVTCSRCLRGNDERMAHWRAGYARIRASRRFLSACLTCGGILAPHSRSMCVRHLTAARRRRRVLSLARVSTGRCIRCNRPREVERFLQCASCRATQRARDARNRAAGTFVAVHTPAGGTRTVRGIGESVRRAGVPYGGAGPVSGMVTVLVLNETPRV